MCRELILYLGGLFSCNILAAFLGYFGYLILLGSPDLNHIEICIEVVCFGYLIISILGILLLMPMILYEKCQADYCIQEKTVTYDQIL